MPRRRRLRAMLRVASLADVVVRVGLLERKVRTALLMVRSWRSQGVAVEPTQQAVPRP